MDAGLGKACAVWFVLMGSGVEKAIGVLQRRYGRKL
jgi:hypothetical protein